MLNDSLMLDDVLKRKGFNLPSRCYFYLNEKTMTHNFLRDYLITQFNIED